MPIILLHDAEGGIITVELKNGETCRGLLDEAEDSMNLVLKVKSRAYTLFLYRLLTAGRHQALSENQTLLRRLRVVGQEALQSMSVYRCLLVLLSNFI